MGVGVGEGEGVGCRVGSRPGWSTHLSYWVGRGRGKQQLEGLLGIARRLLQRPLLLFTGLEVFTVRLQPRRV